MSKRMLTVAPSIGVFVLLAIMAFKPSETIEPEPQPANAQEFMMFTTVESIIPAGLGRSRLFTTHADGTTDEADMENIYSLVGIKMKNINKNDAQIIEKINSLEAEGWTLVHIATGVQSPGGEGANEGIYMTRYFFSR